MRKTTFTRRQDLITSTHSKGLRSGELQGTQNPLAPGRWTSICRGTISGLLLAAGMVCLHAQDPYNEVDPLIGTANGGNTFPGASRPFGMIQWSPDTGPDWYFYHDTQIHGFSTTHLSGAGCPAFGDMPILPWSETPAADRHKPRPRELAFDHKSETAHPGYYAVTLSDGTRVELTVTERAGIARLHFAAGHHAGLLVNSAGSADADVHIAKLPPIGRQYDGQSLTVQPDGTLTGTVTSGGFCGSDTRYTLHIALQLQSPAKRVLLWKDGESVVADHLAGRHAVAWLDLGEDAEHLVKIGLSYVSEAKAQANLPC